MRVFPKKVEEYLQHIRTKKSTQSHKQSEGFTRRRYHYNNTEDIQQYGQDSHLIQTLFPPLGYFTITKPFTTTY